MFWRGWPQPAQPTSQVRWWPLWHWCSLVFPTSGGVTWHLSYKWCLVQIGKKRHTFVWCIFLSAKLSIFNAVETLQPTSWAPTQRIGSLAAKKRQDKIHLRKTDMTIEKQQTEDVSPIKNGNFLIVMLVFGGVPIASMNGFELGWASSRMTKRSRNPDSKVSSGLREKAKADPYWWVALALFHRLGLGRPLWVLHGIRRGTRR